MHPQLHNYLERVKSQLRSLPQGKQDEEVQELHQHLLAIVESQKESGISEDEAVAAALRQFGPPRCVGRSLRKAWYSRLAQERKTTPINKFISAAIWALAFDTVVGMVVASIYGALAGAQIGSQLKHGVTPTGHFPGMEMWLAVVNIGPLAAGALGLLLALFGRLPAFHLERKVR